MNSEQERRHASDESILPSSVFGLNEPSGQFANIDSPSSFNCVPDVAKMTTDDDSYDYASMGWKGLASEPIQSPDDIGSPSNKSPRRTPFVKEEGLDMTPMVDVTFLLLIFFMITAAFTLQKAYEQPLPHANAGQAKPTEDNFVEVMVDESNIYYVSTNGQGEAECPSASEMRAHVRDSFENSAARRLVIVADNGSLHSSVVSAWDAGVINGASKIEIKTLN